MNRDSNGIQVGSETLLAVGQLFQFNNCQAIVPVRDDLVRQSREFLLLEQRRVGVERVDQSGDRHYVSDLHADDAAGLAKHFGGVPAGVLDDLASFAKGQQEPVWLDTAGYVDRLGCAGGNRPIDSRIGYRWRVLGGLGHQIGSQLGIIHRPMESKVRMADSAIASCDATGCDSSSSQQARHMCPVPAA